MPRFCRSLASVGSMVGRERGVGVNSRSRFGRLVVLVALLAGVAGCTSGKAPTSISTPINDLTPQGSIVATEFPADTTTAGATSAGATSTAVASTEAPGRSSAPGSRDTAAGSKSTTAAPSTVTLSTKTAPPPTSTSDVATTSLSKASPSKTVPAGSARPWPTGLSVADQDKAKLAIAAVQNYLRTLDQAYANPKAKDWVGVMKNYETGILGDTEFTTIETMKGGGFHQRIAPIYSHYVATVVIGPTVNVQVCIDTRPRRFLKADGTLAVPIDTHAPVIGNYTVAHYDSAGGAWLVRDYAEPKVAKKC